MQQIFQVQVIDNDQGGHKDLIFNISGLTGSREFDTYFFAIQIEPYDSLQDIKNAIATLFKYWINETQNSNDGETIYLPIDFSDQYTGCLQVLTVDEKVKLKYGISRREGLFVNPLDPGNYSKSILDFQDTEEKSLTIAKDEFINSIKYLIDKLQNGR